MTGFREIRARARESIHSAFEVPALYIVGAAEPVPVRVRVHSSLSDTGGELIGGGFANRSMIQRLESVDQIVFLRSEVSKPARGAVVSVTVGEAYRVDNLEPLKDVTATANVVPLSAAEATGLPVPA